MVAMSGGVDSSVAALLLQAQGRPIAGMFMKNWEEDDRFGTCSAAEDAADARAVAGLLEIDLYLRNFAAEYWDYVFEEFLAEYRAGRTPNPDILCNREIKFKTFLDHALDLGAEYIAPGHYVRSDCRDGKHRLLRGLDPNKDQSYFLYTIGQQQLARTLFPVGELLKPDVRGVAESAGLPVHDKKDSTGICFIGERRFRDFLAQYLPGQPGEIRTLDDELIGMHDGLMFYTIGQRQGLGIGGRRDAAGDPWYVADKDLATNVLRVVQGVDHPALFSRTLRAVRLHWIAGSAPAECFSLTARIRHRHQDQPCRVELTGADGCVVMFEQAQRAVTPGQSVVFYDGDTCLGGGVIEAATE